MEKKNSILLIIITVATLIVAVAGAAFAYFASTVQTENVANIQTVLPASNATFVCTGNTVSITPTAVQMSQTTSASQSVPYSGAANIGVSYSAGQDLGTAANQVTCTYDIVYAYDVQSDNYTITPNLGTGVKEFTYTIDTEAETQFPDTAAGNTETSANEFPATAPVVLTSQTISSYSATPTTKTHNITVKFYNIQGVAQENSGKTITVKFKCANVQC